MKKTYLNPTVELDHFYCSDVMAASTDAVGEVNIDVGEDLLR